MIPVVKALSHPGLCVQAHLRVFRACQLGQALLCEFYLERKLSDIPSVLAMPINIAGQHLRFSFCFSKETQHSKIKACLSEFGLFNPMARPCLLHEAKFLPGSHSQVGIHRLGHEVKLLTVQPGIVLPILQGQPDD